MRAQACGAQPRRHACGQHLGRERDPHHVVRARVERRAQLARRLERRAHDDVRRRELGPRAHLRDQRRAEVGVRDHDLLGRIGQLPHRRSDAVEALAADTRDRQDRPARLAELVQPERQDPRAISRHAREPAARTHPAWVHDDHPSTDPTVVER